VRHQWHCSNTIEFVDTEKLQCPRSLEKKPAFFGHWTRAPMLTTTGRRVAYCEIKTKKEQTLSWGTLTWVERLREVKRWYDFLVFKSVVNFLEQVNRSSASFVPTFSANSLLTDRRWQYASAFLSLNNKTKLFFCKQHRPLFPKRWSPPQLSAISWEPQGTKRHYFSTEVWSCLRWLSKTSFVSLIITLRIFEPHIFILIITD